MANRDIIDRDTYKKTENMNRDELTKLRKIKGIGGKRLEEIMVVIETFLDIE